MKFQKDFVAWKSKPKMSFFGGTFRLSDDASKNWANTTRCPIGDWKWVPNFSEVEQKATNVQSRN